MFRIPTCSVLFLGGPYLPGIILSYDVICTWHVFMHRVQLPMLLLLCAGVVTAAVAAVRRHVPNVKIVADSLNLIPSRVFCFFIEARYCFHVCTLWQYCHICGLGLPILHPL